ncbi:hypothetical protein M5K25_020821 [Dendrobium thyrsiflorum]|uniref:Uncharacterized protein n=1 Tax=Dendrobium thyrsiflorum TaxID=117978 RepID=A0ABD0UHT9_DENTH
MPVDGVGMNGVEGISGKGTVELWVEEGNKASFGVNPQSKMVLLPQHGSGYGGFIRDYRVLRKCQWSFSTLIMPYLVDLLTTYCCSDYVRNSNEVTVVVPIELYDLRV